MRIGPELLQDLLDQVEGSLAAAIGTPDGLRVEGERKRPLDAEAAIAAAESAVAAVVRPDQVATPAQAALVDALTDLVLRPTR